jgi:hypothetical protein
MGKRPTSDLIACEGALFERHGVTVKGKPRVTRTDLKTGRIEIFAGNYQGKPFTGPNDVTIDGQGRLYFTDLAGGAVYRIDAPNKLARILTTPDIQRPNGKMSPRSPGLSQLSPCGRAKFRPSVDGRSYFLDVTVQVLMRVFQH